MASSRLKKLVEQGKTANYPKGRVFYSLDFKEKLYLIKKGYVKRYAINEENQKVIESIYGPDYFFPLTAIFSSLMGLDLSQDDVTYLYQAMTDIEVIGIDAKILTTSVETDPLLYADLLKEAGRRLKANINRLSSNALKSDYRKVSHQLVYLADEFGKVSSHQDGQTVKLTLPLKPIDIAEQLNISVDSVNDALDRLEAQDTLTIKGTQYYITDMNLLRDAYSAKSLAV